MLALFASSKAKSRFCEKSGEPIIQAHEATCSKKTQHPDHQEISGGKLNAIAQNSDVDHALKKA
ncbi:MAG: hypothetical protein ACYYK0_05785 [Candidatus Eutrophobiaceae bacterium]